jgi:hypothetical protein
MHCKLTEARGNPRHADRAAQAGPEGASGNNDPFAACAQFVEHAAGIDLKPIGFEFGKGLSHAGQLEPGELIEYRVEQQ